MLAIKVEFPIRITDGCVHKMQLICYRVQVLLPHCMFGVHSLRKMKQTEKRMCGLLAHTQCTQITTKPNHTQWLKRFGSFGLKTSTVHKRGRVTQNNFAITSTANGFCCYYQNVYCTQTMGSVVVVDRYNK